jgi:hypothetical protein
MKQNFNSEEAASYLGITIRKLWQIMQKDKTETNENLKLKNKKNKGTQLKYSLELLNEIKSKLL